MKMKSTIPFLCFAFMMGAMLSACKKAAPAYNESGILLSEGIARISTVAGDTSLWFRLGDPIDGLNTMGYQRAYMTDTLFSGGGYEWRAKVIHFAEGDLTVEGDFVDEGDPAGKLPTSGINRIRLQTPNFRSPEGWGVGTSISELRQSVPDSVFVVVPIPQYGFIQVSLPALTRLNFLVRDNSLFSLPDSVLPSIGMLPGGAMVESVVIM
jgi:hypothetical protein